MYNLGIRIDQKNYVPAFHSFRIIFPSMSIEAISLILNGAKVNGREVIIAKRLKTFEELQQVYLRCLDAYVQNRKLAPIIIWTF